MPSPGLRALAEPFERVLDAFGFHRERLEDHSLVISCEWGASAVQVWASWEPREHWGGVMLARRLAPAYWGSLRGANGEELPWHQQPYWTRIYTSTILEARGLEPRVSPAQSWPGEGPDQIQRWAELGAADLELLPDLLRGENLDVLDDIIERRPRQGVPGLDFPWPSYQRPQ